ncbi:DUF6339 family protein [Paraburkholderia phenazinium]|uniref:Uncharacterized protein n=1 Tax=Paraburkholderia phenazinium TaxID=60549 RepID=A0A1N6I9A6_9BURK|nr:DUF6339 family protein [Paraburkholderia phenazinium]SIO28590.1 hypothetical protein SAMN05444165_1949 [Paraburkholderia phenazinium]
MSTLLFPQLPHHAALRMATAFRNFSVEELAAHAQFECDECEYTPTGGSRATALEITTLRTEVIDLAKAYGYPGFPNQHQAATFDATLTLVLVAQMRLAPAEAARGGVWAFLACVVLPDIVRWRFGGVDAPTSPERYLSGRRNTFQRLWWRAFYLGTRPHAGRSVEQLLHALGEDELVQVTERPSLAGIEGLAAAVAAGMLDACIRHKGLARRHLMREAQKRLLRLSSFVSLESVSAECLDHHVTRIFDKVADSFAAAHEPT